MNKYEIAKDLTIAALQNHYVSTNVDVNDTYIHMSEQVAENVAVFYNKLVEKLSIKED